MQKFTDAPLTVHENCGGEVEKVISPPAIHFKGSGWYVTDYARNGKSGSTEGSNGKSTSKKTETSTADTPKTDTKAESKPQPKSA